MAKPTPPPPWQERLGRLLLRALSPPLTKPRPAAPPPHLAPFERLAIPRRDRGGALGATWYPADPAAGAARGAVLLVHPWVEWGQAYFHRHGRIESLRAAGYHALTFDQSGVGTSPPPFELSDRDVADAVHALKERAPGLPLHLWAISAGGYWAHFFLGREEGIAGAMFEDVSPHLLEWSWKVRPVGRPAYLFFRAVIPKAYRYIDLRIHAPHLKVRAAAYSGGGKDAGVPADDTRELARLARGESLIVPEAPHLAAIKLDPQAVIGLALRTFEKATV